MVKPLLTAVALTVALAVAAGVAAAGNDSGSSRQQGTVSASVAEMVAAVAWKEGKLVAPPPASSVTPAVVSQHYRHAMNHNAHRSRGGLKLMHAAGGYDAPEGCPDCWPKWEGDECHASMDGDEGRCMYRRYDGGTGCCTCRCVIFNYPWGEYVCVD
jgi:hypothetical protein